MSQTVSQSVSQSVRQAGRQIAQSWTTTNMFHLWPRHYIFFSLFWGFLNEFTGWENVSKCWKATSDKVSSHPRRKHVVWLLTSGNRGKRWLHRLVTAECCFLLKRGLKEREFVELNSLPTQSCLLSASRYPREQEHLYPCAEKSHRCSHFKFSRAQPSTPA